MQSIIIGFSKGLILFLIWEINDPEKDKREKNLHIYTHIYIKLISLFSQFIKFLKRKRFI